MRTTDNALTSRKCAETLANLHKRLVRRLTERALSEPCHAYTPTHGPSLAARAARRLGTCASPTACDARERSSRRGVGERGAPPAVLEPGPTPPPAFRRGLSRRGPGGMRLRHGTLSESSTRVSGCVTVRAISTGAVLGVWRDLWGACGREVRGLSMGQYPSDYNPPQRGVCESCGEETRGWTRAWLALCPRHWQALAARMRA